MNASHYPPSPDTLYAPAGRSAPDELQQEVEACLHHPVIRLVLEMVDCFVVVLNGHRQVLTANQELLDAMKVEDLAALQGLRLGEVMGCIQVPKGADGCGTARDCARCGAVLAILASQALNEPVSGECHLERYSAGRWKPCDFRVRATPLLLADQGFTVVLLQDISAEKRVRQMEGLFLHDLLNMIQGLYGWSELMLEPGCDTSTAADRIHRLAGLLNEEVLQQQMLLHAEGGLLVIRKETLSVDGIFSQLDQTISQLPCSTDRILNFDPADIDVKADGPVLQRVLGNMIINALEATPPGGAVHVRCLLQDGHPRFSIHNAGVIPEMVRHRVFHRGFTTKGRKGHGLGAYMMKFLGENVLEGEVGFESDAERGTCFYLLLPREAIAEA